MIRLKRVLIPEMNSCFGAWPENSLKFEVGAIYWTVLAPDIVNPGREEQGSASV
jgi:hypothetical protein